MAEITPLMMSNAPSERDVLTSPAPFFSVVLPVYNEESNLLALIGRLQATFEGMGASYELIFVDDGSVDGSFGLLREAHERDARIGVIKFSRNFGHHIAISAGLDASRGEYVITMDADLQDSPEEIPRLWAKCGEGYEVVYARRMNKKFSWWRRFGAWGFRWVMRYLLDFELPGGIYRIMSRRVVGEVCRCRERDRMLVGLVNWVGFRQTGIEVEHGARVGGVTKYTFHRQWRLAMDGLTGFSTRPLRVASWLGGLSCAGSMLGLLGVLWRVLYVGGVVGPWVVLSLGLLFLGGVQLLCLGVLGEYVGRIFQESRGRPLYVVEEQWMSGEDEGGEG